MIPYSRPKRSDLYTLSYSKLLENHTLHSGTYLYSPYMAVPPRGRRQLKQKNTLKMLQLRKGHLTAQVSQPSTICHASQKQSSFSERDGRRWI